MKTLLNRNVKQSLDWYNDNIEIPIRIVLQGALLHIKLHCIALYCLLCSLQKLFRIILHDVGW